MTPVNRASNIRWMKTSHIMVIDPAVKKPELAAFNWLAKRSPLPLTYHLPALHGMKSIKKDDSQAIAGIIIFGSLSSVNERTPWQMALEEWLMPQLEKQTPTLGFCYGHQMLAHMFGGKVDYVFPDQKKHVGLRQVSFSSDSLWGNQPLQGLLCVSHNEEVKVVPEAMTVIGKSAEVPVDALRHRTLPVWSFQSHPEAGKDFLAIRGGASGELGDHELEFGYQLIARFLNWVIKETSK